MDAFKNATEAYIKQADYLGDDDLPMVIALQEAAKELDSSGVQASLLNQYRLIFQNLREKANGDSNEVDPLEALLNG